MKKIIFIIILFVIAIFLIQKGSRYVGTNYIVEEQKISNFKKIIEFYQRHQNYKDLVDDINIYSKTKNQKVLNISAWVYKNIKPISNKDTVIDNHPWTIVERKMGKDDQFSDILSVLLIYSDFDSFFFNKIKDIWHPFTFFNIENNKWSVIDPYYGIYFLDKVNNFANLDMIKDNNFTMYHLFDGKINEENYRNIFFDKNFENFENFLNYYSEILSNIPSNNLIKKTHIYDRGRGSRSYVQKPFHRFMYEIYVLFK